MNNWKFSAHGEAYQFSIFKKPNLISTICDTEVNNNEFTEIAEEKQIIVDNVGDNHEYKEKVLSPIAKLIEYVQSPIREDSSDLISSLIDLSGSLESIGVEAHELTSILNETEKARLKLLRDNLKLGLHENQLPIGYSNLASIKPSAFVYQPSSALSKKLESFSKSLETISETYTETKKLYNELKTLDGLNLKNYVLTKQQKIGFYKLILDDDRLSRAELDLLINFMKSSVFANSKVLQQRKEYYANLNSDNGISFPDIAPLLQDVKTLQSKLTMRLEEMPAMLNKEEKQQLQQFLPALDEYYKDQIAAFSGGKSYLPLAKNLQNMQNEIKQNPVASNILEHSESLGFTMQRLYMLHWVAESLMKKKYHTTLGKSLGLYAQENPDKQDTFSFLRNAVKFRNDVAHNGTLWSPEDFEKHIKTYEQGITLIAKELQIDPTKVNLEKINRPLSKEELKTSNLEQFGVDASIINAIDTKLLEHNWGKKHQRVKNLLHICKENKISIEKALEIDANRFVRFYKSRQQESEISKIFSINFFSNAFAKRYFHCESFEILVDNILAVQPNSDRHKLRGWLLNTLVRAEKENKITNQDIETINELRKKLNG